MHSSSVYSFHLFCFYNVFSLSFIVPFFGLDIPLISPIFLKISLIVPLLLFSSISLHCSLKKAYFYIHFSSVAQSCPTVCDPENHSMPGLPDHHQLPEFTQTHVYQVGDAIQPSHLLSSLSPPASNPSQHQSLFQWVNSSHELAKVLEFQLQHQSFQWTSRTDLF